MVLVTVGTPVAEHHREPLGIGESRPRLSWTVEALRPGWFQSAYEIEIRPDGEPPHRSGRIEGPDSVLVPWPAAAPVPASRGRCAVRVRVWGEQGPASGWSPELVVEAGLLHAADWTAAMVTPAIPQEHEETGESERPVLLRGEFHLPAAPRSARLYSTAHGVYELEINGVRAGDEVLAPGWTSYRHRLHYRTLDVTGLLHAGDNALGAWLADGWYRGRIGFQGGVRAYYGEETALLAQLEVTCADGSFVRFGTGEGWRCSYGPILSASLYDGERHDARLEQPGWSGPGFDDTGWHPVRTVHRDPATLVAPTGPPVRRTKKVAPVDVLGSPSGRTVLDFGQNLVGRLRMRVQGPSGTSVTVRHAEILEDGELCTRPLREAEATDSYTKRGDGPEVWEPRFTFHGFRYAEVSGEAVPDGATAQVLHTDMRRTGWFSCSDPLLDRLHENVVWSMRGNFLSVPTDCPQRDERLGWTGDLQVFAPSASFLFDCAGMLRSWLADLAAEQYDDGTVPFFVPTLEADAWKPDWAPSWPAAVWGDVAVLTPWTLYQRFGDRGVLRDQYPSARAWVELVHSLLDDGGLWRQGRQLGDWLDPAAPPEDPGRARTDPGLVASAYFAASAGTLADTADVLGEAQDRERYAAMAARTRKAFAAEYVTGDGRLACDTQTAYALALRFGLLPDERTRRAAARRLARLTADADHRIATGFAGTPLICDALTEGGEVETAYRLLMQRECPSWLYPVVQGATTIWERWDSLLPDGTVNPGEMTSFNHYALGAVADWLHRTVAGLAPAAPGYRRIRVAPRPGGGLTHARARHLTPYGPAEVGWRIAGRLLHVDVVVPPGATALIDLVGRDRSEAGAGTHHFTAELPAAPGS
ncbi:family 78 glycoside hydrolase catalytic domain [Streptomyces sp. FIT100]|nr:family 78 glycoside hydrolase catalytic domain [Streptomyces sp. FIT100]